MHYPMKTRALSLVLALIMILGVLPVSVMAADQTMASNTAYTVTFNANGGTGTMSVQTVVGSGVLTPNAFTYKEHGFKGWNTAANGSGKAFADGEEVTLTGNITLYAQWDDQYYFVVSEKNWDIAPGIKETELVLNNSTNDHRQVLHIMEADMNNPYTKVTTSYTNMDTTNYAVSNMLVQANWVRDNWGWNVVGAMNSCLSWYNSAAYAEDPSRVNEPLGFMMIDSKVYFDHSVGFPTVLVIHKDTNDAGEPRPADIPKVQMRTVNTSADLNGWEDQVIPTSSGFIVKDGVNQNKRSHDASAGAPRSVVGIKPDGTVVIMMNDGRQNPYSIGMGLYELADIMIDLGCSYAVNCDGGGSSTFLSQRPGTTGLAVNCSPSDGALRENTSGVLIISTAPSDGAFNSAYISSAYDYYAPNSEIALDAAGLDYSGTTTEIPAEVTWALSDDTFGTVSNGVFTSTGKTGEVDVQMVYEGKVVGSKTLNIVNPDAVSFAQAETVIPYGKTIPLDIRATYGVFEVGFNESSFDWKLSNEAAGVRDGMSYTATKDESVNGVVISATYKYAPLGTTTLTITFGKGSEVKWDFEDGDVSNWMGQEQVREWLAENNIPESGLFPGGNYSEDNSTRTFLSSKENGGQVKNGNYALGLEVDYRYSRFSEWSYTVLFNTEGRTVLRDVNNGMNATKLGMWVYIPEGLVVGKDLKGLAMQYQLYGGTDADNVSSFGGHLLTANGKNLASLTDADIPEDRWVYFYIDLSSKNYVSLQDPQAQTWREPSFIRFYTQHYTPKNMVFYFDDLTLDYSSAVDDRDAPVISNLMIDTEGNNKRTFNATIADFAATNTSGLDYSSAKIYVDGVALDGVTASGNRISGDAVELPCGTHTVTFEISDKLGNTTKQSKSFTIAGTAPVTLGGHNDLNNAPEYDSVYYVDINVAEIEKIESITAEIDLNTAHLWELDGLVAATGFTAVASVNQYANTVTVTVTKTGDCDLTGAQTLVSIPSRVWSWRDTSVYTAEEIFATGLCPVVPYDAKVVSGNVTFAAGAYDGYVGAFGGSISVVTNLDDNKNAWHTHTAEAIDDLAATCITDGYIGRTYCQGCGSVIDWGTKLPATGHSYDFADGVLKCTCGKLFTGVYTDGKIYVDGVVVSDGWVNDGYYKDGVLLTGVQKVPAPGSTDEFYYDFGENGVCKNKAKYTGLFFDQDAEVYRYAYLGTITTGWQIIDGEHYYFRTSTQAAAVGRYKYGSVTYVFDETGRVTDGVWYVTEEGRQYFYGPTCYYKGWKTIDGKEYYFQDNYCYTGIRYVTGAAKADPVWYEFGEDGAMIKRFDTTGLLENDGKLYYLIDGVSQTGLQYVDGYYYYFTSSGLYAVTGEYMVKQTNGLLEQGKYTFGADYRMARDGLIDIGGKTIYFVNGAKCYAGLIELDGDYYYIRSSFQPATGKYYVSKHNGLLPSGTYEFGADGKMLQGVVNKDGILYHYVNGQLSFAGLIQIDGAYYYAKSNGQLAIGTYNVTRTNGLLPAGEYFFDSNGKLVRNGLVTIDGVTYYFKDNQKYYAGLIMIDGDYYYIKSNCQPVTGKYYVSNTNGLLPSGNYEFGADGKMLQGIVNKNGVLYHYLNGTVSCAGLIEIDGAYYYAKSNGQLAIGTYNVTRTNGLLPADEYYFNAEGKLVRDGLITINGVTHFYKDNEKYYAGLIMIDGDYYYIKSNCQPVTGKYYVSNTNGLLPSGNYEFGADGKMLQGIVNKNGVLYHYLNGTVSCAGLIEIDGAYYYAKSNGQLAIGSYNVTRTNGLLKAGTYTFDSTGKLVG